MDFSFQVRARTFDKSGLNLGTPLYGMPSIPNTPLTEVLFRGVKYCVKLLQYELREE
jgi:hypothetical protein